MHPTSETRLPHATQVIAQEVVNPAHITVHLSDVGGLDHIIEDLVG